MYTRSTVSGGFFSCPIGAPRALSPPCVALIKTPTSLSLIRVFRGEGSLLPTRSNRKYPSTRGTRDTRVGAPRYTRRPKQTTERKLLLFYDNFQDQALRVVDVSRSASTLLCTHPSAQKAQVLSKHGTVGYVLLVPRPPRTCKLLCSQSATAPTQPATSSKFREGSVGG